MADECLSVRIRLDRYLSEGLSQYADAMYEIESDLKIWWKQVEVRLLRSVFLRLG